ncbi:hypothetical protein HNR53_001524 [Bacillus benzoevorans]|uniref:Uncharacterized protein n=1 Tax=Bacillus benzoevorans TaxID=1456 RepID=A0A7X0HQ63_9BACI|nr:hypothetical protein [Bacillus benzoevorans]
MDLRAFFEDKHQENRRNNKAIVLKGGVEE